MNKYLFEYLYNNNLDGEGQDLMIVRANNVNDAIYYFEIWANGLGLIKYAISEVGDIIKEVRND